MASSAGIVNSQSVKAPVAAERGYDAYKKVKGRKRHIAVGAGGLEAALAVGTAPAWDVAYDRHILMDKAAFLDFTVEVVCGLQCQTGFQVQPRRWVAERAFAWLLRGRRLARMLSGVSMSRKT